MFGFSEESERAIFQQLISISGIGPSTARTILSSISPKEIQDAITNKFHSHVIDFSNNEEITKWFNTAKSKGEIEMFVHITGKVPSIS